MDQAAAETPPHYKGSYRTAKPPSCRLAHLDLKILFRLLQDKAKEATEKVITSVPRDQPAEERETMVARIREVLRVHATIEGTSGQQLASVTDPDALDEDRIGFPVRRVTFDSAVALRTRTGNYPENWVAVRLDFDTPPLFDLSNPSDEPTPNESLITVSGNDTTWATAVYADLQEFFGQRRLRRGWIHAKHSYDLLLMFLGLPLTFRMIYLVSAPYAASLARFDQTLRVAIYVYLFFLFLYLFRLGFAVVRWVFPLVELASAQRRGARVAVSSVFVLVLIKVVVDVVKWLVQAATVGIVGAGTP